MKNREERKEKYIQTSAFGRLALEKAQVWWKVRVEIGLAVERMKKAGITLRLKSGNLLLRLQEERSVWSPRQGV